jgi:hypothetical protein
MEHRPVANSNEAAALARLSICFFRENKPSRISGRFLLDTPLSSSLISSASTRHSVTSRIECNYRFVSHLTFSSRHLIATLEKRKNVEKFNTWRSLPARFLEPSRFPEPVHSKSTNTGRLNSPKLSAADATHRSSESHDFLGVLSLASNDAGGPLLAIRPHRDSPPASPYTPPVTQPRDAHHSPYAPLRANFTHVFER